MKALSHSLQNTKALKASADAKWAQARSLAEVCSRASNPQPRDVDEDGDCSLTQGKGCHVCVLGEWRGVIKLEFAYLKVRGRLMKSTAFTVRKFIRGGIVSTRLQGSM